MKKYEIKKIRPLSFCKAFLYILLVPLLIYLLLGIVVIITGAATDDEFLVADGLSYFINAGIVIFVYGLISILAPAVYNLLSGRFGGLEFVLEEKVEKEET